MSCISKQLVILIYTHAHKLRCRPSRKHCSKKAFRKDGRWNLLTTWRVKGDNRKAPGDNSITRKIKESPNGLVMGLSANRPKATDVALTHTSGTTCWVKMTDQHRGSQYHLADAATNSRRPHHPTIRFWSFRLKRLARRWKGKRTVNSPKNVN